MKQMFLIFFAMVISSCSLSIKFQIDKMVGIFSPIFFFYKFSVMEHFVLESSQTELSGGNKFPEYLIKNGVGMWG